MNLENNTTRSQLADIRKHLKRYRKIDAHTAREICGCERLGARIWDLRAAGWEIETDYLCVGDHETAVQYGIRTATVYVGGQKE